MIYFNDGQRLDSFPFFELGICTIYDDEPNLSGFTVDGLDCSDYHILYKKGDGFYQLTNNQCFLEMDQNKISIPTKEQVLEMSKRTETSKQVIVLENEIKTKKEALASTDYIIVKIAEGVDVSEYDIDKIKADRQALRDEINVLEEQLTSLR